MIQFLTSLISLIKSFNSWAKQYKSIKWILKIIKILGGLWILRALKFNFYMIYRIFSLLSSVLLLLITDFDILTIWNIISHISYTLPEQLFNLAKSVFNYISYKLGWKIYEFPSHVETIKTVETVKTVLENPQYDKWYDNYKQYTRKPSYWDNNYPFDSGETWSEILWSYKYYILTGVIFIGVWVVSYVYLDTILYFIL